MARVATAIRAGLRTRRSWVTGRHHDRRRLAFATAALVAAAWPSSGHTAAPATPALVRAVDVARPSLVLVVERVRGGVYDTRDRRMHGPYTGDARGTGWFVNPDGDIVTASHAVAPTPDDVKRFLLDLYRDDMGRPLAPCGSGACIAQQRAMVEADEKATSVVGGTVTLAVLTQDMSIAPTASFDDLLRMGRPATVRHGSSPEASRDVAVLHIDSHGDPAVLVSHAGPGAEGDRLAVIGYPPSNRVSLQPEFAFGSQISSQQGTEGLPISGGVVAADALIIGSDAFALPGESGGPVVDESASVRGMTDFQALDRKSVYLVAAADVLSVLTAAGVSNRLGDADRAWRAGLADDDRGETAAAAREFDECARQSAVNTACARRARTATDTASGWGSPLLKAGAVVLAVAAGAGGLAWRRRNRPRMR